MNVKKYYCTHSKWEREKVWVRSENRNDVEECWVSHDTLLIILYLHVNANELNSNDVRSTHTQTDKMEWLSISN